MFVIASHPCMVHTLILALNTHTIHAHTSAGTDQWPSSGRGQGQPSLQDQDQAGECRPRGPR